MIPIIRTRARAERIQPRQALQLLALVVTRMRPRPLAQAEAPVLVRLLVDRLPWIEAILQYLPVRANRGLRRRNARLHLI